ncbi:MAG: hypothetical protein AAGC53_18035 [Actinomycetota bacterium]
MHRLVVVIVLAMAAAPACSIDGGSGSGAPSASASTPVTAAPVDPSPSSTTTVPSAVGVVEVAGLTAELTATCFAPGAGEVLAVGTAETESGAAIEVYLQAFLGAPYLGITVADATAETTYEAVLDRPLAITYEADILRVDDVALVTDLDLETGEATDAGLGTVVVECRSYETELPSGFVGG